MIVKGELPNWNTGEQACSARLRPYTADLTDAAA